MSTPCTRSVKATVVPPERSCSSWPWTPNHHLAWARLDPDANIDAARAAVNGDNAPRRRLLADLVDVDGSGRPRSPTQLRALLDALRARHARPLPRPREQPP